MCMSEQKVMVVVVAAALVDYFFLLCHRGRIEAEPIELFVSVCCVRQIGEKHCVKMQHRWNKLQHFLSYCSCWTAVSFLSFSQTLVSDSLKVQWKGGQSFYQIVVPFRFWTYASLRMKSVGIGVAQLLTLKLNQVLTLLCPTQAVSQPFEYYWILKWIVSQYMSSINYRCQVRGLCPVRGLCVYLFQIRCWVSTLLCMVTTLTRLVLQSSSANLIFFVRSSFLKGHINF